MGFNLALNVSKNHSKFKSFFEKYDIELFPLTTFVSVISFYIEAVWYIGRLWLTDWDFDKTAVYEVGLVKAVGFHKDGLGAILPSTLLGLSRLVFYSTPIGFSLGIPLP